MVWNNPRGYVLSQVYNFAQYDSNELKMMADCEALTHTRTLELLPFPGQPKMVHRDGSNSKLLAASFQSA
jgi:hypothetical protein